MHTPVGAPGGMWGSPECSSPLMVPVSGSDAKPTPHMVAWNMQQRQFWATG
jgi:hypothetical protein